MRHLNIKSRFLILLLGFLTIGISQVWGAWTKITSAPTDWSGEYLLVYEGTSPSNAAWTGVDASNSYTAVTISNGSIAEKPSNAVSITIATMTGGYSIKVNGGANDGKYISGKSGNNKTNFNQTASANTITYESNSVKIVSNTSVMRYNANSSNGYWFRYYKSSSYTSQQVVQLYKLVSEKTDVYLNTKSA